MGIKDPGTRRQQFLMSERRTIEFDKKAFRLGFVKKANRMSNGLRKIRKWKRVER
jgi:hypothetical protein